MDHSFALLRKVQRLNNTLPFGTANAVAFRCLQQIGRHNRTQRQRTNPAGSSTQEASPRLLKSNRVQNIHTVTHSLHCVGWCPGRCQLFTYLTLYAPRLSRQCWLPRSAIRLSSRPWVASARVRAAMLGRPADSVTVDPALRFGTIGVCDLYCTSRKLPPPIPLSGRFRQAGKSFGSKDSN